MLKFQRFASIINVLVLHYNVAYYIISVIIFYIFAIVKPYKVGDYVWLYHTLVSIFIFKGFWIGGYYVQIISIETPLGSW